MIRFAEPSVDALVEAIADAIPVAKKVVPADFHAQVGTDAPTHTPTDRGREARTTPSRTGLHLHRRHHKLLRLGPSPRLPACSSVCVCVVQVRQMYSWSDVAARTQLIYDRVSLAPTPSLAERLWRYSSVGSVTGWLCCFTVAVLHLVWRVIEWVWPEQDVELARDFPASLATQPTLHLRHFEIDLNTTTTSQHRNKAQQQQQQQRRPGGSEGSEAVGRGGGGHGGSTSAASTGGTAAGEAGRQTGRQAGEPTGGTVGPVCLTSFTVFFVFLSSSASSAQCSVPRRMMHDAAGAERG